VALAYREGCTSSSYAVFLWLIAVTLVSFVSFIVTFQSTLVTIIEIVLHHIGATSFISRTASHNLIDWNATCSINQTRTKIQKVFLAAVTEPRG
jgi:Flp pilus assembly pilin Flp